MVDVKALCKLENINIAVVILPTPQRKALGESQLVIY